MSHEYDDPVTAEDVEAAARMVCDLCRERGAVPLEHHVGLAVDRVFCGRATSIQDNIEGGNSGLHAAVLVEVRQRAQMLMAAERAAQWDEVDEASAQSFPASDPPAWIGRGR